RITLVGLASLIECRRILTEVKPDTLVRWHRKADTDSFPLKMCLGSWASCLPNPVPGSSARLGACLDVKSVREPGAGNPHARFDERGGETRRWTPRRAHQRKTPRALGAAGPVPHRASPRLYPTVVGGRSSVREET